MPRAGLVGVDLKAEGVLFHGPADAKPTAPRPTANGDVGLGLGVGGVGFAGNASFNLVLSN